MTTIMIVFLGEKKMKYGDKKKRSMYMGGMEVKRKPYAHGGKAGYGSIRDMEKACMTKADHNMSMRQE
jgi:hypothetical protein